MRFDDLHRIHWRSYSYTSDRTLRPNVTAIDVMSAFWCAANALEMAAIFVQENHEEYPIPGCSTPSRDREKECLLRPRYEIRTMKAVAGSRR